MSKSAGGAILVLTVANRKLAPQDWEPSNSGRPRPLRMEPFCAATTTSIKCSEGSLNDESSLGSRQPGHRQMTHSLLSNANGWLSCRDLNESDVLNVPK